MATPKSSVSQAAAGTRTASLRANARSHSAASTAYSVTCAPLRTSPWITSMVDGASHGNSHASSGATTPAVLSALKVSDESDRITAVHASGGSQVARRLTV